MQHFTPSVLSLRVCSEFEQILVPSDETSKVLIAGFIPSCELCMKTAREINPTPDALAYSKFHKVVA